MQQYWECAALSLEKHQDTTDCTAGRGKTTFSHQLGLSSSGAFFWFFLLLLFHLRALVHMFDKQTREIRPKLRSKLEKAMGSSIESHAMLQELEWGSHSPSENQGCALVAALLHSVSPKRAIPTSVYALKTELTHLCMHVFRCWHFPIMVPVPLSPLIPL